ncbi:pyridoxal phosphate-dependent transferase [Glomus cerebriforme]|uniref:acetylornithine transaminase n=1 Tax=Glomus cerebriforme TaxID=658196 RepID=A0A397SIZ7_9GLOM|nr:pyridoxal phosphate-dependent transferase [Glomus cerebriforme]
MTEQKTEQKKLSHADEDADPKTLELLDRQSKYTINTYNRPPIILVKGKGCWVYDLADRKYLDFSAGIAVNALGHADAELASVIADQASKLIHLSNLYHNEYAGELAELLVNYTKEGGGFDAAKVFFSNSGTEANEGALKFARKWGKLVSKEGKDKYGVVSFNNAFHGRSMGALSATPSPKYQAPFSPLVPGFVHSIYNDIKKIPEFVNENTCAVIVEPIQGEGGIWEASVSFLEALRKRCDEVNALLIYDEIQCGLGRTGKLWAHQHLPKSCHPDILTMAKPLANGFPIGAIVTTEKVADIIKIGDHGTTFGGNPLACRAALSVVRRINTPELLGNVNNVGSYLFNEFQRLALNHPSLITNVRGKGLILGIQFSRDPTPLVRLARERGLLIITAANQTIRIIPPLILKKEEAQHGVKILEEIIDIFDKHGEN